MPSLKDNKTCAMLEPYQSYLTVVKGRSRLTAKTFIFKEMINSRWSQNVTTFDKASIEKQRLWWAAIIE